MTRKSHFSVSEALPAVAIGAGLFVAVTLVGGLTGGDGMTDEQRAARAQTNGGSPVDAPGQALVGESDYVKVYKGQKVDALQRFGEAAQSSNNHAYPVTPRSFARTVAGYWAGECGRLTGFTTAFNIDDIGDVSVGLIDDILHANNAISGPSIDAIIKGWNRLHLDILTELHGGDPLSAEGTVRFWDLIFQMAIVVDVDRAVPSAAGMVWASIYEAGKEAPGVLGDAIEKVTREASGALWRVLGAAFINILFSPIGLACAGAAIYLYRGELAALSRRL